MQTPLLKLEEKTARKKLDKEFITKPTPASIMGRPKTILKGLFLDSKIKYPAIPTRIQTRTLIKLLNKTNKTVKR